MPFPSKDGGITVVVSAVVATSGVSAAPKPGIQAPKTVSVGEEFTVKTTFLAKQPAKGCFDAKVDWNEPVSFTVSVGAYS